MKSFPAEREEEAVSLANTMYRMLSIPPLYMYLFYAVNMSTVPKSLVTWRTVAHNFQMIFFATIPDTHAAYCIFLTTASI